MSTDNFIEAARAEAPEPCEHHWVSHGQDSAIIPWVIRCDLCGVLHIAEMERLARDHFAAQEPTDAEVEAAKAVLDSVEYADEPQSIRAALSAARAARRDEEKR